MQKSGSKKRNFDISITDQAVNFTSNTLALRIEDIASDRAGTWVAVESRIGMSSPMKGIAYYSTD